MIRAFLFPEFIQRYLDLSFANLYIYIDHKDRVRMLLYSVLCFNSKVNTPCFEMVHCNIMTGGTHLKKKRFKLYIMSYLANGIKEEKEISPGLSHSLRIYSLFGACRTDISAESSQEMKNKI